MNIYSIDTLSLLTTTTQIDESLRVDMMDYFQNYREQHPEETVVNGYIGVLNLYSDATKDYLKYTGMELINTVKGCIFYRMPIERAHKIQSWNTEGTLIFDIWHGVNRTHDLMLAWKRETSQKLDVIKGRLYSVKGPDLSDVRIENARGNDGYILDLIEKKDRLEHELEMYKADEYRHKAIREKITEWIDINLSDDEKERLRGIDCYSKEDAALLLAPYAVNIAEYSGMNKRSETLSK